MSTPIDVDVYQRVITEMGDLVALTPDRVYRVPAGQDAPRYVHGTDGAELGCLIGVYLCTVRGVPRSVLVRWSNHSAQEVIPALALLDYLPKALTDPTIVSFLECLQERQDAGWSWGEAFAYARDYHVGYYGSEIEDEVAAVAEMIDDTVWHTAGEDCGDG